MSALSLSPNEDFATIDLSTEKASGGGPRRHDSFHKLHPYFFIVHW